ncbi:MAG: MoaD/ThiS family protein [Candidatus Sericytochromatia bacterium]
MRYRILAFAHLRELLGSPLYLELSPPLSAAQLLSELSQRFPEAEGPLRSARLAVNQVYLQDLNQLLQPTDEIALIPPVSGG